MSSRAGWGAVALVLVAWLAAAGLLLPRSIPVSADRGDWLSSTSGFRRSAGGLLRGGEDTRISVWMDWPEALSLAVHVRRRSPAARVLLTLSRGLERVHEIEPSDETRVSRVAFEPLRAVHLRIHASALRPGATPAYLLERVDVERRLSGKRALVWLMPLAVGLGLLRLSWARAAPPLATLGALHGTAATAAALAFTLDSPAHLVLSRASWRIAGACAAATLAATVAAPALARLRAAARSGPPRPPGEVHTLAVAGVGLMVVLGFAAIGAALASGGLLGRVFPDIAPGEAETGARIALAQRAVFGAAYSVFLVASLAVASGAAARAPRWLVGSALFLLQLALYAGGLEAFAASAYAPRYALEPAPQAVSARVAYVRHPLFGHVPNPLFPRYDVGPAGFRGAQPAVPKPPGEVRIMCVGDSIVWGWMVPTGETYPARLQQELDASPGPPGRHRVFNAGVPSYDSRHVVRTLEGRVLPYAPDIVLVTVGWNDLSHSYGNAWRTWVAGLEPSPGFSPAVVQWVRALLPEPARAERPASGAVAAFRVELARIVSLVRGAGAAVVLTNLPTVVSSAGTTPEEWRKARRRFDLRLDHLRLFQAVIDDQCDSDSAVHCVRNVFPPSERGKGRWFIDHCHPNGEGYVLVARRIAAALRAQGLVSGDGVGRPPETPAS